ncbi:hypothetical protein TCAL_10421 [Tigriopus californicus]|uniref:Major facilitator superfamily (MFS) profile domain-containing protein n=1 Tax=Tigriopus californicus TaxID=6832 RepID=A0A553PJB9_TIGCA|nr:hypothetical protein TCAL_10421 [Tigriopus californicus]
MSDLESDVFLENANSRTKISANQRIEDILGFGRFQFFQSWVYIFLIGFLGAMTMFQLVFLITTPPTRCALPDNIKDDPFLYQDHVMECEMAEISTTNAECMAFGGMADFISNQCFHETNKISCPNGQFFNLSSSDAFHSLAVENDWVCDQADRGANLMMAQSIGSIINGLIVMQLSDSWGRKPVILLTNLLFIVTRTTFLFFTEYYYLSMVLVAVGSGYFPLGIRVAYTLAAEFTNERGRHHVYVAGWASWVLGMVSLAMIAWACQHWFIYGLITSLLMPESPRLLLNQGKISEAKKVIETIKKYNKEPVPPNLGLELAQISREVQGEAGFGLRSLASSKYLMILTMVLGVTWTVNDFFYIGGQLNVENLAGNQFVNFAIISLTEMPSVFIGEFFINRVGRRWTHCVCMILTTICFAAIIPIAEDDSLGWLVTTLAIVAKTLGNIGWYINYVQNMEIFPTCARVTGMNLTSTVALVFGTVGPYVILLGKSDIKMMYGIFVMMGVIGTITTSFVPETLKQEFPECVEDLARSKRYPYLSWRVWNADQKERMTNSK